jgi:hypothetical protein
MSRVLYDSPREWTSLPPSPLRTGTNGCRLCWRAALKKLRKLCLTCNEVTAAKETELQELLPKTKIKH